MRQLATITVIGKDKTGVIARVTNFLFESGANIEELEQQVQRGRFMMTLQASWPEGQPERAKLERGLNALGGELGMHIQARYAEGHRRQRMAMFVTKETHCFQAIMNGVKRGGIPARCELVVSNHRELEPLARAEGIPFYAVSFNNRVRAEQLVLKKLAEYEIDFIVLARFMKILSPNFVWRYEKKVINIHPSLLPSFPGASAYWQAYEKGVKVCGVTAHFVTSDLDEGPIICQEAFRVPPNATPEAIRKLGQPREAKCLVRAVKLYLTNRLDVHWGKVHNI